MLGVMGLACNEKCLFYGQCNSVGCRNMFYLPVNKINYACCLIIFI